MNDSNNGDDESGLNPRNVSVESRIEEAARHARAMMEALGLYGSDYIDHQEHYKDTPLRFVKYLSEYMRPYDPGETLKTFECKSSGLVAMNSIPYRQVCAHHLLPAFGYAAIGYLPTRKIVGLSKFVRIVDQILSLIHI